MVDYTKPTGSAGMLYVRDNGATVTFLLTCTDPGTFGNVSWSGAVNGVSVGGTQYFGAGAGTITLGSWAVSTAQQVTFAIGATGTMGLGGPTSLTAQITRALPAAPTGLAVARNSDSSQSLGWTRQAVYSSVVIQRTSSDGTWTGWQQVGVAPGNAFSFTDTTTVANRRYVYRVAGRTAAGQSAWSNQAQIDTTPSVPTGVTAVRDGLSIVVDAAGRAPYATSFDVQDGSTVIASAVSLPFTHVSPDPAEPHTYTVRARIGSLVSAWSSPSNTVQLVAPPLAPSNLAPNGSVVEAGAVAFSWMHNPVDASPQSEYEFRYRVPLGAWTTLSGTTASSLSLMMPASVWEWEVRTKGQHPDWSPWSATALVTGASAPGVAVTQPDEVWSASELDLAWSWFQAEGRPQSAWEYELFEGGVLVERRGGSGSKTTVSPVQRVRPGSWMVRVRAATGDLWSGWASHTFVVEFVPPAPPEISGVWDDNQGGVALTLGAEEYGVAVLSGGVWYAEFGD